MEDARRALRDRTETRSARVCVFEVELDLQDWGARPTDAVPGFADTFVSALPATRLHKCLTGDAGGFHDELRRGTGFGHVVEHVLLELIHLAFPDERGYSGRTWDRGGGVSIIQFGAPDFLSGRLAAAQAVEIVKRLLRGERVELAPYLDQLRNPLRHIGAAAEGPVRLPAATTHEPGAAPALTLRQEGRLTTLLCDEEERLAVVQRMWRRSFCEYGGAFAKGIVDKVEMLNIDRHLGLVAERGFAAYGRVVRSLSRLLCACRVPESFAVHSCWLYKNHLLLFVLYSLMDEPGELRQAIGDLNDLFGLVIRDVTDGYAEQEAVHGTPAAGEVRRFCELHEAQGSIVIADSDEMSRRAVQDILEFNGHRTLPALNGMQVLATTARLRGEIGLILLDLELPGMPGRDVCERVRALYPEIPIVLASGYPLDPGLGDLLVADGVRFIGKPFRADQLLVNVRAGLASREPGWDTVVGARRELESSAG